MRSPAPSCLLACAAIASVAPPAAAAEPAAARLALAAPAVAEEPAPSPEWEWSASVLSYHLQDDDNYLLPIVVARYGRLHLEARYNYEDRDTGSLFGGWAFEGGDALEWEAIPMLGAVVGNTDGVAPGVTFSLAWKEISFYSENEYVVVPSDHTENFYYNWSELTWDPLEWLSAGMVTQRTRVYETERDLQRGLMARFTKGRWSAAGYWFNPGSDDDFGILSLGVEF